MISASERLSMVRESLMQARILLPRADPTTVRGEISRAIVDALDALTDIVEQLAEFERRRQLPDYPSAADF